MLTAFKAQKLVELKTRDKSKIESVLAYGDRVIVGLNTGSLRIYRVNEPSTPTPDRVGGGEGDSQEVKQTASRLTDLLHEEEKFSKRAIQQLAVIKEANVLLALTDNHVSIHDLQKYALQEKLEKTRGATLFAVTSNVQKEAESDIPTLVSRLAVAVKRKVLVWTWQDMEFDSEPHEIAFPATIKSLTWSTGTRIVVGMDAGFSSVDIETDEITDIMRPISAAESAGQTIVRFAAVSSSGMGYMGIGGWVPKPMATKLSDGQMLLAKDVNTLFIDERGQALEKRQIPWPSAPDTIGFSYPYLLSLQTTKGTLDVRSPATLTLLQSIPVPNALLLHVPQPNISLAHAGKGFIVASDRGIWRMLATSYESQTAELVQIKRYDEAVSLLQMLEETLLRDKSGQIRDVQMLKAEGLFSQQKYRPALDLFTDAGAPPARVVALYPELISGNLSFAKKGTEDEDQPSDEAQDVQSAAEALKQNLFPGIKTKSDKLKETEKDSDNVSVRSAGAEVDSASVQDAKDGVLEGANLKQAVLALCSFLAQSRVQLQKYLNFDGTLKTGAMDDVSSDSAPPFANLIALDKKASSKVDWQQELFAVARLVDTTLFRAYMFALPSLAGPLFRLDNFCDATVVEEKLYESGRYNDLIDFLQGKKLHRQALELLEKFGQNRAEEEVMPALRGPSRTIAYLQQLPPSQVDLILEFSKWPLETDPKAGLLVFIADSDNAENLPRDRVVSHLRTISPDLALRYLEHVVLELDDPSPNFHQDLIDTYIDRLKSASSSNDIDPLKSKLETFIEKSKSYNKAKTFRQIPADDPKFYLARASVLSAMGNHKQALSIYVFQLHDTARAENYCNNLYLSSIGSQTSQAPSAISQPQKQGKIDREAEDIYNVLLGLYLHPPSGEKTNWPAALELLSAHGSRIPASAALDLMPDDLAVQELQSYFRGRMRKEVAIMNELRIVKGLEEVKRVATESTLAFGGDAAAVGKAGERKLIGRNRRTVVGEDDHCKVCLKRFGNSAVRVWPDGEVVHYGCIGGRKQGTARPAGGSGFEAMKKASWT